MSLNEPSGCARDETLALFLDGGLEGAERARVEEHLGHCDTWLAVIAAVAAAEPLDATREPARAEPVPPPRFERGAFLARGGMGAVFEGLDRHTGQRVAIKRIQPDIADAPEFVDRFEREAEILRRLDHPNIVKFLALEVEGEERQIVMEYVAGGSLRDLLRREGRLPVDRALAIALELSDALARVHHLAIIHRDIKPENILIAKDGTPRLSDVGLSRMEARSLTQTGAVHGTIAYLCPEGLAGSEADARSAPTSGRSARSRPRACSTCCREC